MARDRNVYMGQREKKIDLLSDWESKTPIEKQREWEDTLQQARRYLIAKQNQISRMSQNPEKSRMLSWGGTSYLGGTSPSQTAGAMMLQRYFHPAWTENKAEFREKAREAGQLADYLGQATSTGTLSEGEKKGFAQVAVQEPLFRRELKEPQKAMLDPYIKMFYDPYWRW